MAHFAQLNESNIVTQIIVVSNQDTSDAAGVEKEYIGAAFCEKLFGGTWKQTSYNHSFRKRFAGIGFEYNSELDAFIAPKEYPYFVLDEDQATYVPPLPLPDDSGSGDPPKEYRWDDSLYQVDNNTGWVEKVNPL